ncbi:BON domain-containing protein [Pseudomonas indica]|uniref:Hyperosmotically inducible protein n=1 Tax=Pseudomonas indica TaxID=137658 RepID=A0A1G9DPI8_9PSED|nr:BON domain-containing protein [Pseudomonas indica]PAU61766.1 phospholipid-binding protein [Pseudomonas indica]SDK65766.1 hyperosmotically inducible protein [Pseudomonas indica]
MKQPFNKLAFATVAATALSLSLSHVAFAQSDESPRAQPAVLAANETIEKAEDAVSDTWITSKVKSAFIADSSLSGMDIKVETKQGVVSLSGVVGSDAERDLAIEKAKSIKGVVDVAADGLKTAD